ncbi:MAG TPA: SDR family oxidoreductase [Anaerolineales bacterium]|nr:SDR family oxidoreductase [Anaerolineales bacterium]
MPNVKDLFDLTDRVALVTGAAGLLGRGFARTLAEAGAAVVVADVDGGAAERVAAGLREGGLQALAVQADITDETAVARMLAAAVETWGRLDVLVNSAAWDPKFDPDHEGGQAANAFEDYPLDLWNRALEINLTGTFLVCREAGRIMKAQGKGSIVNLCSTYGLVGPDQRIYEREGEPPRYKPVFYSVTKAGILGLTKYIATYYAGTAVRCNALTPGGVFNDHDEAFLIAYSYRAVMGRMAEPHEMNGALLFLAGDASSYMTGGNLIVDGGWTAW